MRNADIFGQLINLQTPAKYVEEDPWVLLKIRTFQVNGSDTAVPICQHCSVTSDCIVETQSHESLASILCIHAKVCSYICKDFNVVWDLDGALYV